jgi:hypothetical protein
LQTWWKLGGKLAGALLVNWLETCCRTGLRAGKLLKNLVETCSETSCNSPSVWGTAWKPAEQPVENLAGKSLL